MRSEEILFIVSKENFQEVKTQYFMVKLSKYV